MKRRASDQRGGVLAFFALTLPIYIIALGLVADAGYLFTIRSLVSAIADAAALAGVQELDLERLAAGERYIRPTEARLASFTVAMENLHRAFPASADPGHVRIEVMNASRAQPVRHPVTGRLLGDPTVFVEVEVLVPLRFTPLGPPVRVTGRADASVLPRTGRPRSW